MTHPATTDKRSATLYSHAKTNVFGPNERAGIIKSRERTLFPYVQLS